MATGSSPAMSAVRTTGGMHALVTLLIGATVVFALSILLRPTGTDLPWADLWLYNGIMLVAAAIAAVRALSGGSLTQPWLLVSAALVTDAFGGFLYTLEMNGEVATTTVPASDLLWLSYYPLAFIGLLLLTRTRLSLRNGLAWLDALVVGTGSFAVGLALLSVIATPTPDDSAVITVINSLFLIGDLILIVLVLSVVQAFNGRPPVAWWLIMAGYLCVVGADAGYLVQVNAGTYVEGTWLDLLWPLSATLIGLAAWQDREAVPPPLVRRRWAYLGPSISILAAAVVLVAYSGDFLRGITIAAALGTIVLAVVRLNLDVQLSIRLTDQLRRSHVDPLTGLVNRRGLLDVDLKAAPSCALVIMDLDAFKDVNDTLGHSAGDQLLVAVGQRLGDRVRKGDLLARLGGDEFAVLLWNTDADGGGSAAEEFVRLLEAPLSIDGIPLLVTACAGVASSVGGHPDMLTLLTRADTALYAAKSDGPGLVRAFAGRAGEQSQERLRVRAETRAALDAGGHEFVVYYQPMIGIGRRDLLCVESLVRWQHGGRLLLPGEFLPEMVRGGEMPALTRHMLRTSLRELCERHLEVAVTVNVPPELITPWLVDQATAALDDVGVTSDHLIIEITEEAIMKDPEGVAVILASLREHGIRVLLDDFGTGWSGLSSLRDLIVDGIKVDHSFVSRLTTDPTAASIVRGVSQVAADLDVTVIYEGAESTDVMAALRAFPNGYVQGFASARPMPIDDLQRWMLINAATGMLTR